MTLITAIGFEVPIITLSLVTMESFCRQVFKNEEK